MGHVDRVLIIDGPNEGDWYLSQDVENDFVLETKEGVRTHYHIWYFEDGVGNCQFFLGSIIPHHNDSYLETQERLIERLLNGYTAGKADNGRAQRNPEHPAEDVADQP